MQVSECLHDSRHVLRSELAQETQCGHASHQVYTRNVLRVVELHEESEDVPEKEIKFCYSVLNIVMTIVVIGFTRSLTSLNIITSDK